MNFYVNFVLFEKSKFVQGHKQTNILTSFRDSKPPVFVKFSSIYVIQIMSKIDLMLGSWIYFKEVKLMYNFLCP